MRCLHKCGILNKNFWRGSPRSHLLAPRTVHLVYLSSSQSLPHDARGARSSAQNNTNLQGSGQLFYDVLGILGTGNIVVDKNYPLGFAVSREMWEQSQPKAVCGNAEEEKDQMKMGNLSPVGNEAKRISSEIVVEDVSPLVHKVTEIVRSENVAIPMEERLERADLFYNEDIVEKVLKRCFKVPGLAFRFFNWVKSRNGFQHTTETFCTMIAIAGEAKDFNLVEELADEMKKNFGVKNVKIWTILVSYYGKAKLIAKALMLFDEMKRVGVVPDETAYRRMLHVLCDAGKADLALEFYKDMILYEMNLDMRLYKQLLKCLALSGNVVAVHSVGEDMVRLSEITEAQAYGLMLQSFCIAGRITESLELIRDAKTRNIILDSGIFRTLVKGLCSRDRIEDSLEIIEIMKKKGICDQTIYEIPICAYVRRNRFSEAFSLFEDAKKSGNIMSLHTHTNLMQHLFRKNEVQKGLDLYNEMLGIGIQLDNVAVTVAACGYIRENCIDEAWEVFNGMPDKGIKPDSKSYLMFIDELRKASKTDEILKVLNEMQARKVNIGDNILKQVVSYLEKKGEMEKLNAVRRMQRNFAVNTKCIEELNIDWCDQPELTGSSESSQRDQENLPVCLPNSQSCPNIEEVSQILSSSTDWFFIEEKLEKLQLKLTPDDVVEILRNCGINVVIALKFFSWIGNQAGYSHNQNSYHMAMKMAGQGKDFEQMRSLFYQMKRRGCAITPDTWTIMILQYGRTGLTDIALRIFKEMKLSGFQPSKSTYNSLITSLCGKKGRKIDDAIKIYNEMVRIGCTPDKKLLEAYVTCLCEVNKLSDARSCIQSLPKFGFSIPLSYSLYVRALCRAGKLEDALAFIDESGSERDLLEQYTYGSLIHGFLRREQLEDAQMKIKYMKQKGILPTVHVYTDLIIHFIKQKEMQRALQTLDEMKEQGCEPTIVTYSALVCGYVRSGNVDEAWNVFRHLKQNGPAPDFKTYSMFIHCLCRMGKSEEAIQLISEMMLDGINPSTINFWKIIYGLNREGKPNLSRVVLKKKLDLKRRRKC